MAKKVKQPFPSQFETPGVSPGFLLWQMSNGWQREQRAALAPLGLTHVQFVLLAGIGWLEHCGKRVTQARLAEQQNTDPMMTSQVVRALERRRLVERKEDAEDQRIRLLSLTEEGRQLLKDSMQVVEGVDDHFFHALGREKDIFCALLQRLMKKKS